MDGWLDRGVATLLREVLLVQRASSDASASISELVGWCMDNCSGPAAALAALWGQQQASALPPRGRSFYALLLERLGLSQPELQPACAAASASASSGASSSWPAPQGASTLLRPAVMCSSVARAALSTSRRRPPSEDDEDDAGSGGGTSATADGGSAGVSGEVAGGRSRRGGSGRGSFDEAERLLAATEADVIVLGQLPAEAQAQVVGALREGTSAGAHSGRGSNGKAGPAVTAVPANGSAGAHVNGSARGGGGRGHANGAGPVERAGGHHQGRANNGAGPGGPAAAWAATGAPAAAPPRPAAAPGRPNQSLLQRPSRGTVSEPEDSLDPADADAGYESLLGPSLSSQRFGGLRPYIPVRLVATGRFALKDLNGAPLEQGVVVPDTGPVVVSNDPRIFAGTEAVLDYETAAGERLCMRLEYIFDRSYDEITLQLFNVSRIVRRRTENCLMYVNGKPVNVGDPGVSLVPGDEVWFGRRAFSLRVEALPTQPCPVEAAARKLCRQSRGAAPAPQAATAAAASDAADALPPSLAAAMTAAEGAATAASEAAAPPLPSSLDMGELSNLSKRDPRRAEALLRRVLADRPDDAAAWLIWAQMAAREGGPNAQAKARLLFRAAVSAARQLEVIPPPPPALLAAARRATASGRGNRRNRRTISSTMSDTEDGFDVSYVVSPVSSSTSSGRGAQASPTTNRHNWLLVQALGSWAKHEWRLRMYGSARHLFRAAVDEAGRHPDGVAGGGGAAILHHWAARELDAMNVRNARIVAAEALRKCPQDVALYVLAAGVELEGGNLELAKTYCERAYSLDRTDKQLFLVWPRVEAALGDRVKARLLFERALDSHPLNTKIMNLYARFEADEGGYREAAELYDRALRIDPFSPVMGVHNRADWASLEADLGNTPLARQLLEEGLGAHPRAPQLLVTLSKVERLEGRYPEALALARTAQAVAGPFNAAVMMERAQALRALGERELAANLSRHVSAVKQLNRMKQQGYWGSEAWRAFIESTRGTDQRALVNAARARKLQLGWATEVRGAKPQPRAEAGDGRRATAPDAQQWMQLQERRAQRAEARRLELQRAAALRAAEAAAAGEDPGVAEELAELAPARRRLGSSDEEPYYDDDDESMSVPSLDSIRRPAPGDD
ncbi:hypothetical protein HYH03_010655 [Edaphochlamys debaryana]|uniref:Uncharacterized protein n=1 Tax=Edaphochlamys debaryana TaxID=47281 RepID=A0A835XTM9_9CHLO|nr:hypothetical protein HYH03_010655 [Edaphochlamys debaryana]|eukprot:KAG2490982.1 hypothetical protein HYH03_010655 [Edaphochlamys debaryana]